MTPAVCPVCGDDVEWCPQSPGYVPVAQRTAVEYKPQIVCGYCDAPAFVAGPTHSVHCPRYIKPKRGSR